MNSSRDELADRIDELLRGFVSGYLKRAVPPLADPDMPMGQVRCLRRIGDLGTPRMSELSAALDLHPSTVTPLVEALVERGLVQRRPDPDDRRATRVELTTAGTCRREAVRGAMRRRMLDLLADLGEDDLLMVHDALEVLARAASRRDSEHP